MLLLLICMSLWMFSAQDYPCVISANTSLLIHDPLDPVNYSAQDSRDEA